MPNIGLGIQQAAVMSEHLKHGGQELDKYRLFERKQTYFKTMEQIK